MRHPALALALALIGAPVVAHADPASGNGPPAVEPATAPTPGVSTSPELYEKGRSLRTTGVVVLTTGIVGGVTGTSLLVAGMLTGLSSGDVGDGQTNDGKGTSTALVIGGGVTMVVSAIAIFVGGRMFHDGGKMMDQAQGTPLTLGPMMVDGEVRGAQAVLTF